MNGNSTAREKFLQECFVKELHPNIYTVNVPASYCDAEMDIEKLREHIASVLGPQAQFLLLFGVELTLVTPYHFKQEVQVGESKVCTEMSFANFQEMQTWVEKYLRDEKSQEARGYTSSRTFTATAKELLQVGDPVTGVNATIKAHVLEPEITTDAVAEFFRKPK